MTNNTEELDISYEEFLDIAASLSQEPQTIFFDSNRPKHPDNKFSIICYAPQHVFTINNNKIFIDGDASDEINFIALLEKFYSKLNAEQSNDLPFNGGLSGYFGYEFGCREVGFQPSDKEGYALSDAVFGLYDKFIVYDHKRKKCFGSLPNNLKEPSTHKNNNHKIEWDYSRSDKDYKNDVCFIKEQIAKGEFYQVNLTRRLSASKPSDFNSYQHYQKLRETNSAPFSAFAHFDNFQLLCHSPERFLQSDGKTIQTKPIKGTLPSSQDKSLLQNNPKERAENTMIVDLLRNDLSKNCKSYSVQVPKL